MKLIQGKKNKNKKKNQTVLQEDKETCQWDFDETSWERSSKEIKDAADLVNSELGRKRQKKGIGELKGIKNIGIEKRNTRKELCYVCH